jgi:hypothetical protein
VEPLANRSPQHDGEHHRGYAYKRSEKRAAAGEEEDARDHQRDNDPEFVDR